MIDVSEIGTVWPAVPAHGTLWASIGIPQRPGPVTVTLTTPVPAGAVAVTEVPSSAGTTSVAATVPKWTAVAALSWSPLMVTEPPPAGSELFGHTLVTIGPLV